MDTKAIKELEILHEVSKNEHISQRHLSDKLGMAAGLVNLYLKRLAHKGYIKITGINPRRLKYLMTPHGIAEKTRLTYEFALISYKYFKTAADDLRGQLAAIEGKAPSGVVLYGSDEMAELCLQIIKEFDIEVVGVVDDAIEDKEFLGRPVIPGDLLRNLRFDKIIVAKIDAHDEVVSLIRETGIEEEKVCWLLNSASE